MNKIIKNIATYRDEAGILIAVVIENKKEANPPSARVQEVLNRASALYQTLLLAREDYGLDEGGDMTPAEGVPLYHNFAREKDMPLYEIFHDYAKGWFCHHPQKDGTEPFVFLDKESFLSLYNRVIAKESGTSEIREAFGILCDPY